MTELNTIAHELDNLGGFQGWLIQGDGEDLSYFANDFLTTSFNIGDIETIGQGDEVNSLRLCNEAQILRLHASCMIVDCWKRSHRKRLLEKYNPLISKDNQFVELADNTIIPLKDLTYPNRLVNQIYGQIHTIDNERQVTETFILPTNIPILLNRHQCGICFKCVQQAILENNHNIATYELSFMRDCYRLLFNFCKKHPNTNGINSALYFEKVLKIPFDIIPKKFHNQLLGLQERPDNYRFKRGSKK